MFFEHLRKKKNVLISNGEGNQADALLRPCEQIGRTLHPRALQILLGGEAEISDEQGAEVIFIEVEFCGNGIAGYLAIIVFVDIATDAIGVCPCAAAALRQTLRSGGEEEKYGVGNHRQKTGIILRPPVLIEGVETLKCLGIGEGKHR